MVPGLGIFLALLAGCGILPASTPAAPVFWAGSLPPDSVASAPRAVRVQANVHPVEAEIAAHIGFDSVSLRPFRSGAASVGASVRTSAGASARRVVLVTSFQGARYRPETILTLASSRDVLAATAGNVANIAAEVNAEALLLDFQSMSADDLEELVEVSRALADSARFRSIKTIGFVVPPADTLAYPPRILARVADVLVVRAMDEHRAGTNPGPVSSPEWFTAQLRRTAAAIGASRTVAAIGLHGYAWNRNGSVSRIGYGLLQRLAERDAVPLERDPATRALHATSMRSGWEVWLNDSRTVADLVNEARRIGITSFLLTGIEAADPALWP